MATQARNLSREMILPAYKAAISPGPPPSHTAPSNSATLYSPKQTAHPACLQIESRPKGLHNFAFCILIFAFSVTSVEYPLQIRPFRAKRTQSCPPPADSKPLIWQRLTEKTPNSAPEKQTQNEPKRTQTKPIRPPFFAHQGPPKPKRTQTNPNKPNFPKTQESTQPLLWKWVMTTQPPSSSSKTNLIKPNFKRRTYSLTPLCAKTLQTCPSLQISAPIFRPIMNAASHHPQLKMFQNRLRYQTAPHNRRQCLKCLLPVNTMAIPCLSAVAITSLSLFEPPG